MKGGRGREEFEFPYFWENVLFVFKDRGENVNCFKPVSLALDGLSHFALPNEVAFPNEAVIYGPYQTGMHFL